MTKQQRTMASRRATTPVGDNTNADTLSPPPPQDNSETQLNNAESGHEESDTADTDPAGPSNLTNEGKGASNKSKPKGKGKAK